MSADFDVRAKLTLDSRAAMGGVERLSGGMANLGHQIAGMSPLAGGLIGKLVGIGAAYFGLSAGVNTFKSLTASAVAYTSELEGTRIGLQSVLTAVTGASWDEAGKEADKAFESLKLAAIKSPATTGEMFGIFQGIVGPIMSAGYGLEKVEQLTVDTTLAATALHVDFAQASRDISMMARGTAGMEVKLFSLLRSTGAIKEDAKAWNAMDQSKRVEKLSTALAKYRAAGTAFGNSWAGVTSTFKDIRQEVMRAAVSPAMGIMAKKLKGVNDYFLDHQAEIMNRARIYGERAALMIGRAWDRGAEIIRYVIDNWGNITRRIDDAMVRLHAMSPMLLKAAKAYGAVAIASSVGGKALVMGSTGLQLAAMFGGAGGLFGKALLGGGGAAAAGTAAAATGTAAVGTAAAVGESAAGLAATGAAATGAAASLPAVAIGLAAIAAVIPVLIDSWDSFKGILIGLTGDMFSQIVDLGMNLWGVVRPLVYLVGQAIMGLTTGFFMAVTTGIRVIVNAVNWALDQIRPFSDWIMSSFVPAMQEFWKAVERGAKMLGFALDNIVTLQRGEGVADKQVQWEQTDVQMASILAGVNAAGVKESDRQRKLTAQKTSVTNDFRGSRITIDQKFEGDHDPDRVVMAMMGDLTKQAEMRLSTGYANAFTR